MNASELFAALRALPGVRSARVEGSGDIAESRLVGGVEIAQARVVDERPLRRVWRERADGGPVPLLLVVDDPERSDGVRALGPVESGDPIRSVGAEALLKVLERLPSLSRLAAVRELAEELDRLDEAGISGVSVKGLGTEHLYSRRLRDPSRWAELSELAREVDGEWRAVMEGLGYQVERRRSRGYLLHHEGRRVAVVLPLADPAALTKLDQSGRPPEGLLLNDCLAEGVRYGLLAAGSRLRLFEAEPAAGSAVARYLELDPASLSADDRPLLALLSPPYLAEDGFAELMSEARAFGVKLRKRLDRAIRQDVLPVLGRELGRWASEEGVDVADDDARADLEAAALTFVFRALFLLYAEGAGHLPVAQQAYQPHSLSQIVRDAAQQGDRLGARSSTLWRRVGTLVDAMRTGNDAMAVPPYNGALFASDGFDGARTLERATLPDAALGPALAALGIDPESDAGFDYSGLDIGHLGNIYEGLLSLRLSVADRDYRYDAGSDRYLPTEDAEEVEVRRGELLWLTDEGGRKGGGVYYTPEALVRHLVRGAVMPAFEDHLGEVEQTARTDPEGAAELLLRFRVLDPACGSAHFLVAVVDELADRVSRFLAHTPLPAIQRELDGLRAGAARTYGVGIEDAALLRRLVLKRCAYGVDRSRMGAEIAKVSLWLASFVPGLSLAYLDHNVRVGDSLVGVADPDAVREPGEERGQLNLVAQRVRDDVAAGAHAAAELARLPDRTPDEVAESAAAQREATERVAGARRMLDLWAADALGLEGARKALWQDGEAILAPEPPPVVIEAGEVAWEEGVFHWPLEFPEAFAEGDSGFDAVVGNPPWEEVTVEELAFYARYQPGLRALPERARRTELGRLVERRPELGERYEQEADRSQAMRDFFAADTGYQGGAGDPDLYKYFCQRYRMLLAPGGALGVVLPRSAFSAKGSTGFREWLFEGSTVRRLDFLLNKGRWAFDAEPRYTVGLLIATARQPAEAHRIEVAGVAESAAEFDAQSQRSGIALDPSALGPILEVPLLRDQRAADLLAKLRDGEPFPYGTRRWRCFPVRELDETNDAGLWGSGPGDRELWKGGSFDQFDPHGADARPISASDAVLAKARKKRPGGGSLLAEEVTVAERAAAVAREIEHPRVAFRDVARATDSRTVRAALVPPGTFLTNKAPYLAFTDVSPSDRMACLALMNSLAFDWQARRFVETNVNFFILEGLQLPELSDGTYERLAELAGRLSCVDERYADFAASLGVEQGPIDPEERERMRVEIDALVATAWELTADELELLLSDFTLDAVPEAYRQRLRTRYAELGADALA